MSLLQTAERHPVTTILIVGSIAATLAGATGRSVDHLVLDPWTAIPEPWRFFTTIFPHGGVIHLLFNCVWTARLGGAIEERVGPARMVALALVTSVVASACEVSLFNAGIGLSGAVFGFATYAYARGRYDPRFSGVVTRQDLTIFIAWFFFCIIATYTGYLNVANAAHAGGAVIGFLLGIRRNWLAPIFVVLVAATAYTQLKDLGPRLPANITLRRGAIDALKTERTDLAITLYEQIFATGERRPGDIYNYGLAHLWSGSQVRGYDAFIEAYELDPEIFPDAGLRREVEQERARRAEQPGSPRPGADD